MTNKLIIFLALLVFLPSTAFSDCTEQCYDSKCVVPGACEMKCENNECYYYDKDDNCWKYDEDKGYYPCGCDCYKCDDSCYDHDDDCDWDDCDEDDCFIKVIQCDYGN